MREPHGNPLRPRDVSRLRVQYELASSEVLIDARLLERWLAPEAELQDELGRRHGWPGDRAANYLADLRHALRQQL
jgi:hypothetical protein